MFEVIHLFQTTYRQDCAAGSVKAGNAVSISVEILDTLILLIRAFALIATTDA
jgi:hypothetical protein